MNGYFADASGTEKDDARGENPYANDVEDMISAIIKDVCDLPDNRDDMSDELRCAAGDLELILRRHLMPE